MGRFTEQQTNQLALLTFFISTTLGAIAALGPYSPSGAPTGFRLFSLHPLFLMCGLGSFVMGKLYKTLGGYHNTKLHGNLSVIGSLFVSTGVYAIYQNKESIGKPHFTSTHSQYALFILALCFLLFLNGLFGLHPDWGKVKTNKNIRFVHHWAGKLLIVGMSAVCWTGAYKIIAGEHIYLSFGAPLGLLAALGLA